MSQKEWGNITWYLFHTLAEKIKEEHFESQKDNIINFIITISNNLPCPTCTRHASETLKFANINLIETKDDLIEFVRQFHNIVNLKLNKNLFSKSETLKQYKRAKLIQIVNNFFKIHTVTYGNFNTIISTFHRHNVIKSLHPKIIDIVKYCN